MNENNKKVLTQYEKVLFAMYGTYEFTEVC